MIREWMIQTKLARKTIALVLATVMLAANLGVLAGCGQAAPARILEPVDGPIIEGVEAFHVIVASGEPEGVAAALSAARNGLRTLMVEEGDALGGLMTLGWLNFLDQNHVPGRLIGRGPGRILLTQGVFQEFYDALGNAFDVNEAKEWFWARTEEEPNLTVMLNTEILGPIMDGNTVIGLEVREWGSDEIQRIRSLVVIDSTVDGDVAAAAVFGIPDDRWGEAVTAAVVLRAGATADAQTLIAHVRARKGAVHAPKRIAIMDGLPRTPVGKIDKTALRARMQSPNRS